METEDGTLNISLSPSTKQLARRYGKYGFDAPYVPITLGLLGIVLLSAGIFFIWLLQWLVLGIICLVYAVYMLLSTTSYIYTTRHGKFQVWAQLLSQLRLHGEERVIDLGCGRGAVLLMVAKLLPNGRAIGVDLWKTSDQSGNAKEVTQRNAELEGVAERIELYTADMQKLPFADGSFDVVLSSLAIHNIQDANGRLQTISEAVRVLKPGGQLLLADFRGTQPYKAHLQELGMIEVTHRRLDWRFWYGSPWTATKLICAHKPA
jgi:arsenite methyltransferase